MKPEMVGLRTDGAQAWVTKKNPDGTYSGYLLEANEIRRNVANLRTLLSGRDWKTSSTGRKILKPPKASEPKMFNNPAFDAPFRKAPKPKKRKK
jgi:hypothetical protein